MNPCKTCGLTTHTGPCQDAIRAHYEGRIERLRTALERYGEHDITCARTCFCLPCTCRLDKALKGE